MPERCMLIVSAFLFLEFFLYFQNEYMSLSQACMKTIVYCKECFVLKLILQLYAILFLVQ